MGAQDVTVAGTLKCQTIQKQNQNAHRHRTHSDRGCTLRRLAGRSHPINGRRLDCMPGMELDDCCATCRAVARDSVIATAEGE